MKTIKTYWWRGRPNFGDELAPYLISRFSNMVPEWAPINEAKLLTIGSVLDTPPGYQKDTVVLGSGKLYAHTTPGWAKFLAVRGPMTRDSIYYEGMGSYALGDPGLLANELVSVRRRTHNLGLLPHWSDKELHLREEFLKYDPMLISPEWTPLQVVEAIGMCKKIVTSSLHGAIVADSFGIPRRIEVAPRLQSHEGGLFKFLDYSKSINLEFKTGVTQRASRQEVETLQHILFDLYEGLEDRIHAL